MQCPSDRSLLELQDDRCCNDPEGERWCFDLECYGNIQLVDELDSLLGCCAELGRERF